MDIITLRCFVYTLRATVLVVFLWDSQWRQTWQFHISMTTPGWGHQHLMLALGWVTVQAHNMQSGYTLLLQTWNSRASSSIERAVHSRCKLYSSVHSLRDHGEASQTRWRYENRNLEKCALQLKSLPSVTVTLKIPTLLQHYCYHNGWKKSKLCMCQQNWQFLLLSLSKTYKHALINTLIADLGGRIYCKSHVYSDKVCVYKLAAIHTTGINIPIETKTHAPVFINFLSCILINLFCCLQIRICFQLYHIFWDVFI